MKDYEVWKNNFNDEEEDIFEVENKLYALRYIIEEIYCQDAYCDCYTFVEDVKYLYQQLSDNELRELKEHNRNMLKDYISYNKDGSESVEIYRGYINTSVNYNLAVSFTPLKDYAEQFAILRSDDYREDGYIIYGKISIDDIIWTYQQNNNESLTELIVKPHSFIPMEEYLYRKFDNWIIS